MSHPAQSSPEGRLARPTTRLQDVLGRLTSPVIAYGALAVGLGIAVYWPIVRNYFHTEDFDVLHTIANRPLLDWVFVPSAGHLLIGRNLLFGAMYTVARGDPAPYFWSQLLIHIVNTALLYAIVWTVTRSARLACAGATAWAIAPANEGTLGWYSYAGHVVATLMLLIVVLRMVQRARDGRPLPLGEVAVWGVLMLIGAQTLGFGLGSAFALPIVAMLVFGTSRVTWPVRGLLLALPASLVLLYSWLGAGQGFRAISSPLDTVVMSLHLQAVGFTTLLAGFGYPLDSYPSVTAHAIAAVATALCLLGFAMGSPSSRRIMLAVVLFAAALYGSVALGRATLYRKFMATLPVYGASLPRYHYAATAMLAIAVCVALAQIGARLRIAPPWSDVVLWVWLACAVFLYAHSGWRIDHFDAERRDAETAVQGIYDAVERTPADQLVLIDNVPLMTAGRFPYFAGWASIYTIYFREPPRRPVYFIDPHAVRWYQSLGSSPLTRALFPPPEGGLADVACPVRPPLECSAAD